MDRTDSVSRVLRQKGQEIFSVAPTTSVFDALAVMAERGVGALLVMEDYRLVGVISERDYARKVILQGRSSRDTAVHDIMTEDLVAVTPEQTVDDCMRLMTEHRIRHLPVMQGRDLLGVVSMGDLVKHIISAQRDEIEHLQAYITGSYVS